jgi:hypothetical protein
MAGHRSAAALVLAALIALVCAVPSTARPPDITERQALALADQWARHLLAHNVIDSYELGDCTLREHVQACWVDFEQDYPGAAPDGDVLHVVSLCLGAAYRDRPGRANWSGCTVAHRPRTHLPVRGGNR